MEKSHVRCGVWEEKAKRNATIMKKPYLCKVNAPIGLEDCSLKRLYTVYLRLFLELEDEL